MKFMMLFVVMMLAVGVFAADVDYSGTWAFNKDKSEMPEFGGQGRGNFTPPDMVVTQKKNKITVERTMTGRDGEERKMETVYDLSGKTTKEKGRRGNTEHTAKMKDGILNIESVRAFSRDGMDMEMVTTSTWTLVDEGKGLLVESVSDTPMGERKMKSYYDKK